MKQQQVGQPAARVLQKQFPKSIPTLHKDRRNETAGSLALSASSANTWEEEPCSQAHKQCFELPEQL